MDAQEPTRTRSGSEVPTGSKTKEKPKDKRFTLERKLSEGEVIQKKKTNRRTQLSQGDEVKYHRTTTFSPKKQTSKLASFFKRSSTTHIKPLESENVIKERETIVRKYEPSTKQIILLQSYIRTTLIRRNFFVQTKHTATIRRNIFKVLNSLLDVESKIVKVLKAIYQSYHKPLTVRKTLVSIPKESVQILFFNTKTLLSYHQSVEKNLQNFRDRWPLATNIGRYLAHHLQQLSLLYTDYVKYLRKSEEIIEQHFSNTIGKLFLRNKAREHTNEIPGINSLKKLLSFPTTYLISYRNYCLDFLYAMSPFSNSSEYPYILYAASMSTQIQSTIERQINCQDMEIICDRMSKSLTNISPVPNYKIEGRKFIREARVTWKERKKLRLFLFSDILLVTKAKGKKYIFIEELQLSDISVSPPECISAYSLVYYRLITPNKTYPLMERKNSGFITIFEEFVSIASARSLAKKDISNSSPALSPFALKLIYYIDKSRIKDGLFRASVKNFKNGLRLISDESK